MGKLLYESESYVIRGGCFEVYKQFRSHHKEKVYGKALTSYLRGKGLTIEHEKQIPIYFGKEKVGVYILDIAMSGKIFVELKCKPFNTREDKAQFWHHLQVSCFRLGFLVNFGAEHGVEIIRRVYGE